MKLLVATLGRYFSLKIKKLPHFPKTVGGTHISQRRSGLQFFKLILTHWLIHNNLPISQKESFETCTKFELKSSVSFRIHLMGARYGLTHKNGWKQTRNSLEWYRQSNQHNQNWRRDLWTQEIHFYTSKTPIDKMILRTIKFIFFLQ